jgi:hypothetical protein
LYFLRQQKVQHCKRPTQLQQDVLCCQNIARCHCAHVSVITLMPTTKARPSHGRFSRNSQMLNSITCRSLVPNFTQIGQ